MKRFEKHLLTKALPLVLCGAMVFGSSAVAASVPAADSSLKTGMSQKTDETTTRGRKLARRFFIDS